MRNASTMKLLANVRFYVLLFSLIISVAIYAFITRTVPAGSLQTIKLTQTYALTAVVYLYLALLAGPLCFTFRFLPFRGVYLKARRAIGVSAFYFGSLHAYFAFFKQLGGFGGLGFLSNRYLLAILLSFTALIILTLMASTSFDAVIVKLTYRKWKLLHRFVYLAGILILIHAMMLGTHFQNLASFIPQLAFVLVGFLFILEAVRIDAWLQKKFVNTPRFGLLLVVAIGLISFASRYIFTAETLFSLGIHAQHIQLAKEIQQGLGGTNNLPNIPGLQGDRSKRFTVSFLHSDTVKPNQDTILSFQVFDAASGNQIPAFTKVYDKFMHLIIVDSQLQYFTHIHPELQDDRFTITTQFPAAGIYHVYLNFQPAGAIEQQFAFTFSVGSVSAPAFAKASPDTNFTKTFATYEVTLSVPFPIKASDLAVGGEKLTFTIKGAASHQPIKTLKPYLAAFGHLVMINQDTFDYVHVHPTNVTPPSADANGGPVVEFLPLGLYGPIKPGIYRVFAQFNPDGSLIVADYTIKIE